MSGKFRIRAYCAISAFALLSPAAALAQAESSAMPGDIIVTARRSEERLQDVPISITVYTQEAIADRNIAIATDLATYTPSLSVNQRFGPEKAAYGIRGFNQDNGTAPAVGVYFADVVGVRAQAGTASGNTVGAGTFMDLQNVQVLKGPQGTLQGRNTTGGAVLLVPNKPTDRFEGWAEGTLGNYDAWRAQGVINVPLSDTLRIRASVDRNKRDGYMKNVSGIGPDAYNDLNYVYARFSALWDITSDIENHTIAHYSHSFSVGYANRLTACDPTPIPTAFFSAGPACAQIARQAARGDSLLDVEVSTPNPKIDIETWQVINTTTWRASDSLTVKNIFAYGEFRERSTWDLYSSNWFWPPAAGTAGTRFRFVKLDLSPDGDTSAQRTITEELQFQGTLGNLTWQAGGYLEFSRPIGFSTGNIETLTYCADVTNLVCENPLPGAPGNISNPATKYDFDNHGLYAQGTYDVTEQLSVTGGFRYTFDTIFGIDESTRYASVGTPNQVRRCNNVLVHRAPNSPTAIGKIVTDRSECHFELTNKSNKPTWLIGVDYKPMPDVLVYAKYSRGYRQGGINFTNVGEEMWGPEKVDAYEIGAKASFRGAVSGYINVAAFYNDLRNQQIAASLGTKDPSVITGGRTIINTGTSTIKGIEVEGSLNLFRGFRLDFGYTHLNTELKDIFVPTIAPESPFTGYVPTAVVGEPLNFAPEHRLTTTATYTLPLDETFGDLSVGATYTYTAESINDASMPAYINEGGFNIGLALGVIPPTHLLNLNVNWDKVLGTDFDAAFFMTNVTNELYATASGGTYNTGGFGDISVAPPRMWGMRLRYNFGN